MLARLAITCCCDGNTSKAAEVPGKGLSHESGNTESAQERHDHQATPFPSRHDVMEKYGVKRTTLAMYIKNESDIMEAFDSASYSDKRKQLRTAAHPELEDTVLRWIRNARELPTSL